MKENNHSNLQFRTLIAAYLHHLERIDSSPHTVRHYRTTLLELADFLEKDATHPLSLPDVTLASLSSYLSYKKEKGTSGRTRRNYIITFRSFWKFLLRQGYTKNNPAYQLEDIHVEKKERIYLTVNEMEQFLNVIDKPIIYSACSTICYSGLRISELCQMKLKEVSFTRNQIHVVCGKGKKDRIIPLNRELKDILESYINHDRNPDSIYLFSSATSGRLSQQYLNQMIHIYAKKAGVNPKISAHCLRHSFASALVAKGAPITSIQRLLGHTDLKTTNIYMHVDQKDLARSIDLLSNPDTQVVSQFSLSDVISQISTLPENHENMQDMLPYMLELKETISALYYSYLAKTQ